MSNGPQHQPSVNDQSYRAILDYLNRRGHTRAAAALTADLAQDASSPSAATGNAAGAGGGGTGSAPGTPGASPAASGGGKAVGLEDFADRNAPSQPRTPAAGAQPRRRPDQAVASGQMLADPPSWEKGYEGLRNFVDNVSHTLTNITRIYRTSCPLADTYALFAVTRHPSTRTTSSAIATICALLSRSSPRWLSRRSRQLPRQVRRARFERGLEMTLLNQLIFCQIHVGSSSCKSAYRSHAVSHS